MKPALRRPGSEDAARLRQRWQALPPRQRVLAVVAASVLAAALLWWWALGPALALWRSAPAQHQALDAQLQRMRQLQAQAQPLKAAAQSQPAMNRDTSQRALEAAVRQHLGDAARLAPSGDAVTLTLTGVAGDALAQWLAQARIEARALPTEARLNRNANGLWEGRLTLALPAR